MKKHGILNSDIAKILADLGHTDTIVIGDAGLPVPPGVVKIDLALKQGMPSFHETVTTVLEDMVVENVFVAKEVKEHNPTQDQFFKQNFQNIEYVSHDTLKKMTASAKAVIRTGEVTPYSNCILQSGVFF